MTVSVWRMSGTAGLHHQSPGCHFPHFLSFPYRGIPARPKMVPTSQPAFHPKMDGHARGRQGQSCHHRDTVIPDNKQHFLINPCACMYNIRVTVQTLSSLEKQQHCFEPLVEADNDRCL